MLSAHLPVACFSGDPQTPDALFPNNVYATAPGRYLVGRMRHPVRQREAGRADIRGFFRDVIGYGEVGRILGEDLHAAGHAVTTFDVKLGTEAGVPVRAHAMVRGRNDWIPEGAEPKEIAEFRGPF